MLNLQIYNLAISLPAARPPCRWLPPRWIARTRSLSSRCDPRGADRTSSLADLDANTQTADVDFQVPTEKADAMLDLLRGYGEVMQQDLSENPDYRQRD